MSDGDEAPSAITALLDAEAAAATHIPPAIAALIDESRASEQKTDNDTVELSSDELIDDQSTTAENNAPSVDTCDAVPLPEIRTPKNRSQIRTARLDPRELKPSWPIAIASLEQLSSWAVLALRLGTLSLIQQCVKELSEREADPDLIVGLRDLVDALAHMPLEA